MAWQFTFPRVRGQTLDTSNLSVSAESDQLTFVEIIECVQPISS